MKVTKRILRKSLKNVIIDLMLESNDPDLTALGNIVPLTETDKELYDDVYDLKNYNVQVKVKEERRPTDRDWETSNLK